MIETEVKRVRKYEHYDIKDVMWDGEAGDPPQLMEKMAYSKSGDWIGSSVFAYRLVRNFGIQQFEKTSPEHCVCSIGFAPKDQKWYGWSQRGMFGFEVGSKCKKGDCHYKPATFEELQASCEFNQPDEVEHDPNSSSLVRVRPCSEPCCPENCIFELGKGTWVATTIEQAKQMAMDFAESVS